MSPISFDLSLGNRDWLRAIERFEMLVEEEYFEDACLGLETRVLIAEVYDTAPEDWAEVTGT